MGDILFIGTLFLVGSITVIVSLRNIRERGIKNIRGTIVRTK